MPSRGLWLATTRGDEGFGIDEMTEAACAWAGTVADFVARPEEEILRALTHHCQETGGPQLYAWHESLSTLRVELQRALPAAARYGLVIEYELPRSGGRRPDLILLENGIVLVVEFKNRVYIEKADLDQVRNYAQHLEDYHEGCRGRHLVPVLVPLGMRGPSTIIEGVRVVPPSGLGDLVGELAAANPGASADVVAWTNAPYAPLPGLIEAARLLFKRQPLPRIRRAESAGVLQTVHELKTLARRACKNSERWLALLAGVPGSGKTLAGLELVHSRALPRPAVFVSGNGPLVQVLQYALGGGRPRREFVQDVKSYLRDRLVRGSHGPERIVVFDEAQRAWDANYVLLKHRGHLIGSEPELFLRVAEQTPGEPFVLVALVGEGQEIHAGEEGGIAQWVAALASRRDWQVAAPPHLAEPFRSAGLSVNTPSWLNLTFTLRSHRALHVAQWVDALLENRLADAAKLADDLRACGFALYMARELEPLRDYARQRYARNPGARYGLLASSKFRRLHRHGARPVRADYWYYGEWYEEGPDHPRSCCRLDLAVTEFGCQGLELDLPIVCWGPDMVGSDSGWDIRPGRVRARIRDPRRLRQNAYRVLLTRGRDGLAIFVPRDEPGHDATAAMLEAAGVRKLP